MGRFQLELIYLYFPPSPTVNCPSQEAELTSTPIRPVDNVVITTKGLQDRNINILDGTTVENKSKLILIENVYLLNHIGNRYAFRYFIMLT